MKVDIVKKYFNLTFKEHRPDLAARLYLHENYKHRDAASSQNKEEFIRFFREFFKDNPDFEAEILMEVEGKDTVVLMVRALDQLVAEFYQFQGEKIKNHWHIIQKQNL